ncbi:hypothetical protein [Corynebacterium lubricantis]|uniref:Cap15 family cyclic dinucleotide receptor domain-containing protein n=1 Tax=Corynebacterium lubricantis TaxID=541095 RepID=UPI000374CE4E|nr:hypothetical protein [Corynebacterium lubricantis]
MHAYATDSRAQAYAYLTVLAVVIAVTMNAVVVSTGFSYGWLISSPSLGAAFIGLLKIFDIWAWRWKWLRKIGVTTTPAVDGIYEGTIRSTYADTVVDVRLIIDQRWLRVLIRFEVMGATTSTSRSSSAAIHEEGHHDARLTYTYSNQVRPGFAEGDMHDHDGAAEITITPEGEVSGRYFNARGRQGVILLKRTE